MGQRSPCWPPDIARSEAAYRVQLLPGGRVVVVTPSPLPTEWRVQARDAATAAACRAVDCPDDRDPLRATLIS